MSRTHFVIFAGSLVLVLLVLGLLIGIADSNGESDQAADVSADAAGTGGQAASDQPSEEPTAQQAAGTQAGDAGESGPAAPRLTVHRIDGPLPVDSPYADVWNRAPIHGAAVQAQMMTMPILEEATIGHVRVQAMRNDERIAWRLSWDDATKNMNVDAGRFTDAVAIQFPLKPGAPFPMGAPGAKVQILHWKGVWQKDIDEHFQDVQDLHPNYWADLYWFAEPVAQIGGGKYRYRVPESFKNSTSKLWFIGHSVGNPMSKFQRATPVEELVAAGFGTLTHQESSVSAGRGAWRDGQWSVVFARPLTTDDPNDFQFTPGTSSRFAVAVWEGSDDNVGGRKHWSNWTEFKVTP